MLKPSFGGMPKQQRIVSKLSGFRRPDQGRRTYTGHRTAALYKDTGKTIRKGVRKLLKHLQKPYLNTGKPNRLSIDEMIADLPKSCDVGCKKNSKAAMLFLVFTQLILQVAHYFPKKQGLNMIGMKRC